MFTTLTHKNTEQVVPKLSWRTGFTSESFEAMQLKVSSEKNKVARSLIIRQHEEWGPAKDKCYEHIDTGTGSKTITLAKDALVFLMSCINGN